MNLRVGSIVTDGNTTYKVVDIKSDKFFELKVIKENGKLSRGSLVTIAENIKRYELVPR